MEAKSKKDFAMDFINMIRAMEPSALNRLIIAECGEDLAKFFLDYTTQLIAKNPDRVRENTSAVMLMGYLIKCREPISQYVLTNKPANA